MGRCAPTENAQLMGRQTIAALCRWHPGFATTSRPSPVPAPQTVANIFIFISFFARKKLSNQKLVKLYYGENNYKPKIVENVVCTGAAILVYSRN